MNRSERRRQERAQAKRRPIIVGDGIVARSLGEKYEGKATRNMPPKEPGRHRWICAATYSLNLEQAAAASDPDIPKVLDHENLVYLAIGCWDCEKALGEIAADSACEAEASD